MIIFLLLFSYFSQADLYGEFILKKEIDLFIPSRLSFFSPLQRKKGLLFLESSNRIILYSEGVFKPLIFDIQGNYLGFLETSFFSARKINYQKKEIIVLPMGNVLEFYTFKNKNLNPYRKLAISEYIESFNFLKIHDSLFIVLSCSDKKENKIKIYNQNFKLINEKPLAEKFLIEVLYDTLILGIEKNFKKLALLDRNLYILWEFSLRELLLNDYALCESLLVLACSDIEQDQGIIYFLSLKNGKLWKTLSFDSLYSFGFSSVKVSDIDNDAEKEIIFSASGKKGEVFIFKKVKDKLILKKKRVFHTFSPLANRVNVLILEVGDFIYDRDKNKELILLLTYTQKTDSPLPNNFNSGQILLVDNKLKDIADLDLNSPLYDFLIVKKHNKKESMLVILTEKLRFYE